MAELNAMPNVATLDIETIAKDQKMPKSANMILLGMAARYIEILSADQLRSAIKAVFARKGEATSKPSTSDSPENKLFAWIKMLFVLIR